MTSDAGKQALECAAAKAITSARILPSTFRAAVTRVEEEQQEYRRAAYVIESRTVRLGVATAHGTKKSQVAPRPDPKSVDPWKVDPRALPGDTRTIAVCPSCEGTKKVTCSSCVGAGALRCGECGGGGRVMGQRGPKNCPSCRGNGSRRCPACNGSGRNKCDPCEALGRVRAWLEVAVDRSTQVRAHPKTGAAALHHELELAQDVERDPSVFPFPLVSDTGWGLAMPPGLAPELIVSIDPFTDRISARRLQVFRPTVFHCHYETRTGSGVVQVAGRPPQVLSESQWEPWRRRWFLSLVAGGLMLALAVVYYNGFVGRAEWFAKHSSAGTVAMLGLLAVLFSVVVTAGYCLPRPARGWLRFRLPATAVAGAWLGMLLLWLTVTPSPEGVRVAVQRGDLQAARREARAVEVVDGATEELSLAVQEIEAAEAEAEQQRKRQLDDEHLLRVKQATSASMAAIEVARAWEFEETREAATELLLQRADAEMQVLAEQHDSDELEKLAEAIAPLDESRAARVRSRHALARAFLCRRNGDFSCVATELGKVRPAEGDQVVVQALEQARQAAEADLGKRLKEPPLPKDAVLEDRKTRLRTLLDDAKVYSELTGQPPPVDVDALGGQLEAVERALEKERKEEEARLAREERKAAREAAREEARRAKAEAAAARRADRVQCCDGTLSPSCRYSQGSLRGCCSHHRGVC